MTHPHQDSVSEDSVDRKEIAFSRLRSLIQRREYTTARDLSALLETTLDIGNLTARLMNERFAFQLDRALSRAHLVSWPTYQNLAASTLLCSGSVADDLGILMASPSTRKPEFLSSVFRAHHSHTNCEANLLVIRELINLGRLSLGMQLCEELVFRDKSGQIASFYRYFASSDQPSEDFEFGSLAHNHLHSRSNENANDLRDAAGELIRLVGQEYFAVDVISHLSCILLKGLSDDDFSSNITSNEHLPEFVGSIRNEFDWISFAVTGMRKISDSNLELPNYGLNPCGILQSSLWIIGNFEQSSWQEKGSLLTLIRRGLDLARTNDRWLDSWIRYESVCLDQAAGTEESEHFVLGQDHKPIDNSNGRHWITAAKAMIRTGNNTIAATILGELREIGSTLAPQIRVYEDTLSSLVSLLSVGGPIANEAHPFHSAAALPLGSLALKKRSFSSLSDLTSEQEITFLQIATAEFHEPSEVWTTASVATTENFLKDLAEHHGEKSLSVFVGRMLTARIFSSIDPRLSVRLYRQIRDGYPSSKAIDDSFRWQLADLEVKCLYLLGRDREAAERVCEDLKHGYEGAERTSVIDSLVTAINSLENMQSYEAAHRLSATLIDAVAAHIPKAQASDIYLCLARTHESNGFQKSSLEFLKRAESALDKSASHALWISVLSRLADTSDRISSFSQAAHYWNLLAEQNPRTADYYSRRAIASAFHASSNSSDPGSLE